MALGSLLEPLLFCMFSKCLYIPCCTPIYSLLSTLQFFSDQLQTFPPLTSCIICFKISGLCCFCFRIPTGKSLFDGYIPSSPPVLPKGPARDIYCHCQDGTPECSSPDSIFDPTCLEHISICSQTLASLDIIQNWLLKPIQPRIPVKRGNVNGLLRRRRRDTGATSIGNLDYGYDSSKFEYADVNSTTVVVPNLVWPTKTGITQQQAQSYCYSVLWQDSPLRNVCRSALTDDDINKVVAKCVLDIQVCKNNFYLCVYTYR